MIVTATEFKTNIGKYLTLVDNEDILITKNGKSVARLIKANEQRISVMRPLRGVLKDDAALRETLREERLAKYDEGNA